MKKVYCIFVVLAIIISLCGCGNVKLTESQETACNNVTDFFNGLVDYVSADLEFSHEIEKVSGNITYIATLNINGNFTEDNLNLFADSVMPRMEEILSKEDMYIVLYMNENGSEEYRIIDSKLDPNLLD